MRILVVGPTGRTGRHVIAALRDHAPSISIRGFCRHPQTYARAIEVIPGNMDGGTANARAIEVIPGNMDGGTASARAIEVIPGNMDGGTTSARAIEVIPGNMDGGTASARAIEVIPGNMDGGTANARAIEVIPGNLESPADRAGAVAEMDVVIHYGPACHPREAAMGTGMIDAAVAAGVRRFIYISVLNPQTPSLPDHAAKRAVEGYLAESGLDWTVLRPQRYMQNINVAAAAAAGRLELPFPGSRAVGHVDMADLAQAVARVALEDGHAHAAYDIASDEALTVPAIAAIVASVTGKPVTPGEMPLAAITAALEANGPVSAYARDAMLRLYAYQARHGSRGNANVLRWLLGREPASFESYVRRTLAPA